MMTEPPKKRALLIGVSQYNAGLNPIPGAKKDVEDMKRVLENPELGGFDEVKALIDPDLEQIRGDISHLFRSSGKQDLVLLYFSGHGILDYEDDGSLYLATPATGGSRFQATSVEARFIQKEMNSNPLQQRVVILDCCYSGAFQEGWAPKSTDRVDIQGQFNQPQQDQAKGQAVLTSSSATQKTSESKQVRGLAVLASSDKLSFEHEGAGLYTQYLVDGIETGAADIDKNGTISTRQLHNYAAEKVKVVRPAMEPLFYHYRNGSDIVLANSPRNDPELEYRLEVEKVAKEYKGEIPDDDHDPGRYSLNLLAKKLELSPEDTQKIEAKALEPYKEHKKNRKEYKNVWIKAIENQYPPSQETRSRLDVIARGLGLTDEDKTSIEMENSNLFQRTRLFLSTKLTFIKESPGGTLKLIAGAGVLIALIIGGISIANIVSKPKEPDTKTSSIKSPEGTDTTTSSSKSLQERSSSGEKSLLKEVEPENKEFEADKQKGVEAFAKGDYKTAIKNLESAREKYPNSPETLIYLNNARAAKQPKAYLIAAPVPIKDYESAMSMLRGFAQAQDAANRKGGINGVPLKFLIIDDDNENQKTAIRIASELIARSDVLGVTGHYSSDTTLAVAPIYNKKLPLITPISTSSNLAAYKDYVFRTNLTTKTGAEVLVKQMLNSWGKTKVATFNARTIYSNSLIAEFNDNLSSQNRGQVVYEGDLSKPNFNAAEEFQKAKTKGAEVLLLVPGLDDSRKKALAVVKENRGKLNLLGDIANLYDLNTLKEGRDAEGMVMAVSWSFDSEQKSDILEQAQKLWGNSSINWKTAMSYDAAQAMIEAIKRSPSPPSPDTVQQELSASNLSIPGTSGKFSFSGGARFPPSWKLVEIRQANPSRSKTGYDFVTINK